MSKDSAKLVCVMGVDGSGKSTVTEYLAERYRSQGYSVDVLWLRYNHFLSKPLLGFCRLVGLTEYKKVGEHRVGYHHFYRSASVSNLFILLQYLDALRAYYFILQPLLRKRGHVVILDRFVYDILVDVAVDTRRYHLAKTKLGAKLLGLLPPDAIRILIQRNWESVLEARPEGEADDFFKYRFREFNQIAEMENINVVENDGTLVELFAKVDRLIGLKES